MRSPQQRIGLTQTQRLELNTSLQASIAILRTDAAGLTRYLEEQAAENPHLRLEPPPAPGLQDWLPRWAGVLGAGGGLGGGLGLAAETADTSPSLMAHVMAAIEALHLGPKEQKIAVALAEVLEPSEAPALACTEHAEIRAGDDHGFLTGAHVGMHLHGM